MYGGHIHSQNFVKRILDIIPSLEKEEYETLPRIEGMLRTAYDEMLLDEASVVPPKPAQTTATTQTSPPAAEDELPATTVEAAETADPMTIPSVTEAATATGLTASSAQASQKPKHKTKSKNAPLPTPDPSSQPDHHPFYFIPSNLARVLHCEAPNTAALRGALMHMGYRVTRSHCKAGSIKTDAPWSVLWDVMREWVRQKAPVKEGSLTRGMAGWKILYTDDGKVRGFAGNQGLEEVDGGKKKIEVRFDEKLGADKEKGKLVRYQVNPRANWGPMSKAKGV
jgi:tRNA (guanine26-N2/guanine27-N2)-dimethyltransferase